VSLAQVRAFSPPLADLKAADAKHGITVVADEIERRLNRMARVRSGPDVTP